MLVVDDAETVDVDDDEESEQVRAETLSENGNNDESDDRGDEENVEEETETEIGAIEEVLFDRSESSTCCVAPGKEVLDDDVDSSAL